MTSNLNRDYFIQRVGRRVFLDRPFCPCELCQAYYDHGYHISSRTEANYMFEELQGFTVFETKKERDEYIQAPKQI